jgi:hypothetical protein
MKPSLTLLAVAASIAALTACGKAQEKASEKVAEKMIESALEKDGSKAKVDLASGGVKVTTTDASGKTSQMEMGTAKVTEADVGVPFYPGTQPGEGQSTKVSTPDGDAYTTLLHSADAPDKVAAFYRDKLKAQSAGKQFMDMSGNDGNSTFMLNDDQAKSGIQVHVMKADNGTDIQIMAAGARGCVGFVPARAFRTVNRAHRAASRRLRSHPGRGRRPVWLSLAPCTRMRRVVHLAQVAEVELGVDLCRRDARVPEQFLNRAQVAAALQQVRSE